jgi:hypothetical protein
MAFAGSVYAIIGLAGPAGCAAVAFGWHHPRLNRAVPPPPLVGLVSSPTESGCAATVSWSTSLLDWILILPSSIQSI